MSAYVWGGLAALSAVLAECIFRAHVGESYLKLAPLVLPLGIFVNIAVYNMCQTQTLIGLAVVFSGWTAILRVLFTFWKGDEVSSISWASFSLILLALALKASDT